MRAFEYDPKTQTVPGLDLTRRRGVVSLSGFASEAMDSLGEAIYYKDKSGRVSQCRKEIGEASLTLYLADEFIDSVEVIVSSSAESMAEQRVATHQNMLKGHQKILAGNNGSTDWFSVAGDSDATEKAASTLSSLDIETISSRSWVDLLLGTEDEEEIINVDFFEEHLDTLTTQARAVKNAIPEQFMEVANARLLGKRVFLGGAMATKMAPATDSDILEALKMIESTSWLDDKLQRQIDKHTQRLLDSLVRLRTKPDEVYAEGLTKTYKNVLGELIKGFVDVTVAEQHNEYFTPVTKKQKRNKRLAEYTKKQAEIDGTSDVEVEVEKKEPEKLSPTECHTLDTELERHCTVKLDFPWIEGPQEYPIQVLKGADRNIYVVNAQEDKVASISSEVKKGLPKNDDGKDGFDQSITHRARALASGIMPYSDPSVKKLKNKPSELREAYKKTAIWYTFDISPNAPRLYFTVKPAPKNIGENIGENDLMMVVLAETDKAHQIDILKRFTNKSHRALVQQGAGSV